MKEKSTKIASAGLYRTSFTSESSGPSAHCLRFVRGLLYQNASGMQLSHRGGGDAECDERDGDDGGEAGRKLYKLNKKRKYPPLISSHIEEEYHVYKNTPP